MQQQIDAIMNIMKDAMILGTGSIMVDRRNIMSDPFPRVEMNHVLDSGRYTHQRLGSWDRAVMSDTRPTPNRVEVTPDLIRIFDWAYKNRIEIRLRHDSGMANIIFKRGDRHRELAASDLRGMYRVVADQYRQIFAELRCPALNLEG